jgi:hypothetical protein
VNSEPELSAEARRVIASAKGYDDPSPEDRERVKSRWLASVAAAASVSALGEAARAASSSGWGAKAIGWVVALAAGAAGVYVLLDEPSPPAPTEQRAAAPAPAREPSIAPASAPSVAAAPAPSEAPPAAIRPATPPVESAQAGEMPSAVEAERTEVVPRVARSTPAKPPAPARPTGVREPSSAPPEAAAVEQGSAEEVQAPAPEATAEQVEAVPVPSAEASRQLGEEALLLSKIRRSLSEDAPARALEELAEYRRRFDKPLLGMEAAALRVDALCRSGNVAAGRAEAELFQATWPSSPLEQRVRAACQ